MSQLRLAICIPAYNQPDFLREALTSLCDQGLDRNAFAVVVADDASPTPLGGVIEEFQARLPLIHKRHERNLGHIANWDSAWQIVDAPFVAFLAHDDVVTPGHFARALAAIEATDDAVLVSSLVLCQNHPGALNTHPHGVLLRGAGRATFARPYRWEPVEWMALASVATPNSIVGSVFRTAAFRQCREWTSYPLWHDRLMLAEMGLHGAVLTLPWIAGHYRTGDWQLSARIWQPDMSEFRKATGAVLQWCQAHHLDVTQFWIDQICSAPANERVMYLQMVSSAFEPRMFAEIKGACESRLKTRLRMGRLERMGVPAPIAALVRKLDRRLLQRR